MINLKDIRIGNILNIWTTGKGMQVRPVNLSDFYKEAEEGDHLSAAEPVILNNKWLQKFAFRSAPPTDPYGGWLSPEIKNGYQIRIKDDVWDCGFTKAPIQYVHQLQNLHYALTQEELPIKL